MEAYQERVVVERNELTEKISAFGGFLYGKIFESLDVAEQNRLVQQYRIMRLYRDILTKRILFFGDKHA